MRLVTYYRACATEQFDLVIVGFVVSVLLLAFAGTANAQEPVDGDTVIINEAVNAEGQGEQFTEPTIPSNSTAEAEALITEYSALLTEGHELARDAATLNREIAAWVTTADAPDEALADMQETLEALYTPVPNSLRFVSDTDDDDPSVIVFDSPTMINSLLKLDPSARTASIEAWQLRDTFFSVTKSAFWQAATYRGMVEIFTNPNE